MSVKETHSGGFIKRKVVRTSFLASLAGLVVFAFGFLIVPYLLAEAHAETTSASVDWSSVQITLNTNDTGSDGTSGDVEFSTLSPTANNL
ncbi:hypothetical protein IJ095_02735, partial [Candidatus Saccharibacteria bacterium]|nr:hypothetical protein [Candidatus Saccharibacteria bacterium]